MPLLRLTNISIAYGTHALLKNADFQLDAGERVGLLGRNGEGKSTLMKIIAGNVLPDHGDCRTIDLGGFGLRRTHPCSCAAAGGTIVIRAGTGDGGDGLTPHQQIIQNFEDKNPNIIVQLEPVSGRDYYARLLTQLAAKAAPDIMQIGDDAVPSFVTKDAFVPLDTYLKNS